MQDQDFQRDAVRESYAAAKCHAVLDRSGVDRLDPVSGKALAADERVERLVAQRDALLEAVRGVTANLLQDPDVRERANLSPGQLAGLGLDPGPAGSSDPAGAH